MFAIAFIHYVEQIPLMPSSLFYIVLASGAPNERFLSDPLKRYFRLSGVPLKLCRLRYNIFICSVILGELESFRN